MKIAVAPTVMGLELLLYHKVPPPKVVASVMVVCLGVALATVTDSKIATNLMGMFVGMMATLVTGMYQIWAGALFNWEWNERVSSFIIHLLQITRIFWDM